MTTQLDHIAQRLPSAQRIGQATAVEQSRAVAEVQAAIVVAQQCPRNVSRAIEEMRETCRRKELADRAFFRYKRGGNVISGPSIHLARELARVWGNIQYGLSELRRDDDFGQSEMLAFAWDVQTNSRCSSVVINPHRLYTGGRELTELRDIYENNANVGARRVREAIFAVLPAWFTEEAKDLCAKTIADGGGVPLPQRVANAIEVFGNLGITVPQLETKVGAPSARWTDQDVAQLRVIRQSLMRGEISKDEEFPPPRLTGADITGAGQAAPPAETPSNGVAKHEPGQPAPKAALEKLDKLVRQIDLGPDEDVRSAFEWLTGEPWTATRSQVDQAYKWLDDHLKAANGDVAVAADAAWKQYRAANPQAADDGA